MRWKELKVVDFIIVHASATPETMDIGVEEIRQWHRQKGWLDVGYHRIVRRDGTREPGRALNVPGAHARGFNHRSIGICLIGGVESDKKTAVANFTHAQWEALEEEIRDLKKLHPNAEVIGHCDLPKVNKRCPCFNTREWWASRMGERDEQQDGGSEG